MTRKIVVLAVLVFSLFVTKGLVSAAEGSGGVSVDVMNNYVWRGIKLSDDHGVTQPSISFSYGNYSANYWASYDNDTDENNETDLTLSYTRDMGKYGIEVGYIYYDLDVVGGDSHEIYASISYDILLSPSVTYYHDIGLGGGGFLVGSIGHTLPLSDGMDLNLGASASMNFENEVMESGTEFTGLYNGEISASVSMAIPSIPGLTVEPKIAYSAPLSDDAERAIEGLGVDPSGSGEVIYGGVGVSFSF